MKKSLVAFLLIFVCIFLLFSCTDPNSEGNGGEVTENTGVIDDDVIFSPEVEVQVVYVPENVSDENIDMVLDTLKQYSKRARLVTDTSLKATHEVVVGRTKRDISQKAYRQLETLDKQSEEYIGYCIYSDGTSVAIAYDEAFLGKRMAEQIAIDFFLTNLCKKSTLKLSGGIVDIQCINAIEYQEELDEIATAKRWAELEESLIEKYGSESAAEIVNAQRELYSLYTDDMIDWFANLYDPVIGGFYYSNSARNSEGYLPDLESTYQTLGFIATSGMISGKMKDFIPKDMQKQLIAFAKGLQDSKNGYFYHPQWSREDSDAHPERLGRDISNAVKILAYFGEIPLYDAPDGTVGENRRGTAPASKLTERLSSSNVSAVSKVVAVSDESGVPDHLLNESNFRSYLAQYDGKMKNEDPSKVDAYWVGNLLESMATQIVKRDEELKDSGQCLAKIATDWLTSYQNPATGLWEPYEGQEYDCVNGILKISSAYNKMGYPVPNGLKLLDYAIDAITSTADPHHVCCVLNTWYAISILTTNISTFSATAEEDIAKIRDECIPKYPEMVRATRDKFALFVKDHGSSKGCFSYFQDRCSDTSQSMKVALDNQNEADVNATYVCSAGVMGSVFGFIGERAVNLFSAADGMRFLLILQDLGVIVKDKEIDPVPIEFDGETIDMMVDSKLLDLWLPSGELVIEEGRPYGDRSTVLRFTAEEKGNLFQLYLTKSQGSFNAVAFESDMMFMPEDTVTYEFLMLSTTSTARHTNIMFKAVPDDGVYVYGLDFSQTKIANVGEWFNLRVEYGKVNNITVKTDIYINREYKVGGSAPYGDEALSASSLRRIQFSEQSGGAGDVSFDNMFLEQFTMKKLPTLPDVDTGPSETETGVLNFDYKVLGAYFNQGKLDRYPQEGTLSIVDSTPYGKVSKVIELISADGNLFQTQLTKTQESFNAIAFEADVMFNTSSSASYDLLFFGSKSADKGGHMIFSTDGTSVYVAGDDIDPVKIGSAKAWFKLKVVYTKVSNTRVCMEVFVNDKSMAISTSPHGTTVYAAVDMTRIQFKTNSSKSSDATVQFDNVSLMQVLYELPELPEEVIPEGPGEDETGLLTFDAKTLNGYKSAGLIDSYTPTGSLSILDGKNHGWDSKVLELASRGKQDTVQLNVTKGADGANALSFETDIMFTATVPSEYELLFFGSSSSNRGGHVVFYADDDGVFVYGDDFDKIKFASLNSHFHLKVVYTKVDENRVCMEIIVDEQQVVISTAPYSTTVFDAKDMTRIQFAAYHKSSATGAVYFDNTGLLRINYEIPKLPSITPDPDPTPDPTPTPSDSLYDDDQSVSGGGWT